MKKSNLIKIALPKGRLLRETASLIDSAGWGLDQYGPDTRIYRLQSNSLANLQAKIFHEKDIPVQVAVGNYDLGICGLDWVEELLTKYPHSPLIKVKDLEYGYGELIMTTRGYGEDLPGNQESTGMVRIASEYPNIAEAYAINRRLPRFSVFPLWGSPEVYPPESAELAVISRDFAAGRPNHGIRPVCRLLGYSAYLIGHRYSWENKDMSVLLGLIEDAVSQKAPGNSALASAVPGEGASSNASPDTVWLALPDGHQQPPTCQLLKKAGIEIVDYPSSSGNRRPKINLPGINVKVIRPQDMPLQVACGNFDLAITGHDWVTDHRYQFPSSPVVELLDLKQGRVKIVAVVSNDLPVKNPYELRQLNGSRPAPLRVASEYVNIADRFSRDNRIMRYCLIPTWGATEAFIPEDADLLIENTETGQTITRNNLKIIDTLFESTACLIGRVDASASSVKKERVNQITERLKRAVEDKK